MGYHIQPQEYLSHFSSLGQPSHIWIFDKVRGDWLGGRAIPIRAAMQAPSFYSDADELFLAKVEGRGREALEKVRREVPLTPSERDAAADYVVAAFTRSPWVRRVLTPVAQDHKEDLKGDLAAYLSQHGLPDTDAYRNIAAEWLDMQKREIARGAFRSRHPNLTTAASEYFAHTFFHSSVRAMGWRALRRPPGTAFATSDSPSLPCGKDDFQFPLSSEMCLVGSTKWTEGSLTFEDCTGQVGRIINANTLTMAERFVGFHSRVEWIPSLVARSDVRGAPGLSQPDAFAKGI